MGSKGIKIISSICGWIALIAFVAAMTGLVVNACKANVPQVKHESLTVKEIKEHRPKHGYVLDRWDYRIDENGYHETFYEPDGDPFVFKSASINIVTSGIEDGMIYTCSTEMQEDGNIYEYLYINEPYSLDLIAMGVTIKDEDRDLYLLYTFMDKDGYTWYDKNNATQIECD